MTLNMKSCFRILLISLTFLLPLEVNADKFVQDGVTIAYETLPDNTIKVKYADNKSQSRITLVIDGRDDATINANSSAQIQRVAKKSLRINYPKSSGPFFWRYQAATVEAPAPIVESPKDNKDIKDKKEIKEPTEDKRNEDRNSSKSQAEKSGGQIQDKSSLTNNLSFDKHDSRIKTEDIPILEKINLDSYYGQNGVSEFISKCHMLSMGLTDAEDKVQFIKENDIEAFIADSEASLKLKKDELPVFVKNIISTSKSSDSLYNLLIETLDNRLNMRQHALDTLKAQIDDAKSDSKSSGSVWRPVINLIILLLILIGVGWAIIKIIKKQKRTANKNIVPTASHSSNSDNGQSIVVRRKTASILKKQNIDDVVDNPEYMVINTSDFVNDSAVRNIYIKNSCIKAVYNMYEEDLRNTDNPKEDGCMVLGRWIHDENENTYDVSLESVVYPGDDAIFKEYELNFGGKIKLRIAEKLRKLRKETNLQYDLVCWIHSHPGLGVFFSNSDNNVQSQLKHSTHPNFLIAFVVDILTSSQEMGIFTFRKDGSIISKGDLKKLYSLEDMYKWALESEKASFNADNYYNILSKAQNTLPLCVGIELNNNSIIDLTKLTLESSNGITGWAIGTSIDTPKGKEYLISSISPKNDRPSVGVIGAIINETHFSLPTIQRVLATTDRNFNFIIVFSSRLNTLTTIPVINGEPLIDEQYYGDQNIDDLKIWTRRKR